METEKVLYKIWRNGNLQIDCLAFDHRSLVDTSEKITIDPCRVDTSPCSVEVVPSEAVHLTSPAISFRKWALN